MARMGMSDRLLSFSCTPGFEFHSGATRAVAVIDRLAVKVALDERGLRCNRFEQHVWRLFEQHKTRGQHLCPVLWSDPRGRFLAMPAAGPLDGKQVRTMKRRAPLWWRYEFDGRSVPWERKEEDWGVLEGRIVALDYAATALFPLNEFEVTNWDFKN